MTLTDEDIREILRIIDESPLDELRLETEGFSLHVLKGGRQDVGSRVSDTTRGAREPTSHRPSDAPSLTKQPEAEASSANDGLVTIESPMLGTFYRAEGPGKPPFVEVGTKVDSDSTVCIIEVMKMMNSVPAGTSGTIVEICRENAELVEYGEPLFRVQPA